jgi:hypothetical protein
MVYVSVYTMVFNLRREMVQVRIKGGALATITSRHTCETTRTGLSTGTGMKIDSYYAKNDRLNREIRGVASQ